MTFKDIFPGLSSTLSSNFQDFAGPKWYSRTFQVLEFSREKNPAIPRLSRRRGNPATSGAPQAQMLRLLRRHYCC